MQPRRRLREAPVFCVLAGYKRQDQCSRKPSVHWLRHPTSQNMDTDRSLHEAIASAQEGRQGRQIASSLACHLQHLRLGGLRRGAVPRRAHTKLRTRTSEPLACKSCKESASESGPLAPKAARVTSPLTFKTPLGVDAAHPEAKLLRCAEAAGRVQARRMAVGRP